MAQSETRGDTTLAAPHLGVSRRLAGVRAILLAPGVREALTVWALSRALLLLLTYFGVILFNSSLHAAHPSFLHQLLPAWHNPLSHGGWDTQWYIDISQRGYAWRKAVGTTPAAFFPLYPLLIHTGVAVTRRSPLLVGLVISNLAFLAALIYLYRLSAWELNRAVAARTILYIAIFPTALFFFAGYTESLFLLLTVACFFHLRRGDWLIAGLFGALASATRVTGVLLVFPFAYEYAYSRNFSLRRLDWRALGALLIPSGLGAFMLYLWRVVGDPLAFTHDQAAWQKIFTLRLWAGTLESFRQILIVQPPASFFQAHNVINVGIGLLFLGWSVYAARRLPASYTLYLAAFWLVTLSSPAMAGGYPVPLISLSRYVLSLFPIFMYLGVLGRRRGFHDSYLVIATGMLALLTIQFLEGGWVV